MSVSCRLVYVVHRYRFLKSFFCISVSYRSAFFVYRDGIYLVFLCIGIVSISFCCLLVPYRLVSAFYRYRTDRLGRFYCVSVSFRFLSIYRYYIEQFFLYISIVSTVLFVYRYCISWLLCISVSYRLVYVYRYRMD